MPRLSGLCAARVASTSRTSTPGRLVNGPGRSSTRFPPRRTATPSSRSPTTWWDAGTSLATFRLATRGSTLAMIQAKLAADALARRYPEHEFILVPLAAHGDRHPTLRLTDSAREGVFVKELEQALVDGRAELAVHSAKDLPTIPTPGLRLAAFLERADAHDVLIARPPSTLAQLPRGSRFGTGSPRRAAQIAAIRPDLRAVEIRGNVDTRLRRLAEGAVDALILAAAGLERLGRLGEAHELLPFAVMLPAPGQGALALQAGGPRPAAEVAGGIGHPHPRPARRAQ